MLQTVLIVLIFIVLALLGFVFSLLKRNKDSDKKEDLESKDDRIVSNLTNQISLLLQTLGTIQKSVDQRLGENTGRLDNAARSYGEVQKQLTHLQDEVRRVHEVGKDISSLHEILRAPKVRGVMGEIWLEKLLGQMLPQNHYQCQYAFKSGEKVDAIIRLQDHIISVDSKFPLENFKKAIESQNDEERAGLKKQFGQDVKKHISSIADKYILPGEGTMEFAIMYIPAENVYYEIINHNFGNLSLFDYAVEKKVIPVSPNTFYAYLGTIIMGLKGMRVEENAKFILQNLSKLQVQFMKIRKDFESLGSHIRNAQNKYEATDKRLSKFETQLEKSGDKELEEAKINALKEGNIEES
ncbi:MAG TPA: DNA recombination protein RmuC [Candidatus Bathyarchaeia archaeon]|nr:DNA recombination protein RmuC [Candidatus Bathyarchaeia archaeon]